MPSKKVSRIIKHTINKISKSYGLTEANNEFCFYAEKLNSRELEDLLKECKNKDSFYDVMGLSSTSNGRNIFTASINKLPSNWSNHVAFEFFKRNVITLKKFVSEKNEFENNFIKGRYDLAAKNLDNIDKKYGASLWSFDSRLSLLVQTRDETAINELINNSKGLGIYHIATILRKKHLSTSLTTYMRQIFENLLNEYRGNNQKPYIDFVSFLVIPHEFDKERCHNNIINHIQQFNYIDRYLLLNSLMSEYFSSTYFTDKSNIYNDFVSNMASLNIEHCWLRMSNIINETYYIESGDIELNNIINSYSRGNYKDVVSICKKSIIDNPSDLTLYEILAKSGHYLTCSEELDIDEFAKIEGVEQNSIIIRILVRMCILFQEASLYESTVEELNTIRFKFRCINKLSSIMALIYTSFPYVIEEKSIRSSLSLYISNTSFTSKYQSILSEKNPFKGRVSDYSLHEDDNVDFSESRVVRKRVEQALQTQCFDNMDEDIIKLRSFFDITKPELFYLISTYLMSSGKIIELISLISEECVKKPENIRLFPMKSVISIIENEESGSEYRYNINSVVCCYLYMSIVDIELKEMVSEVFEDYLSFNNFIVPSEKLFSSTSLSKVETYFYDKICSKDIMSTLITIDNNNKLIIERLKIINLLSVKYKYQTEYLLNEEKDLVQETLYKKVVNHHESNKLSIDVDGIKKAKFEDYRIFLYELCLMEGSSDAGQKYILSHFNRYYPQFLEDFVFNKSYGLIRYLSSEIRHGVLPNQIRSVLEAYEVITEVGDNNQYESNEHWIAYLSEIATPSFVNEVNNHLSWFSLEADKLISTTNTWPDVSSDINNNVAVFNYSYGNKTIEQFKTIVLSHYNLEEMYIHGASNNDVDELFNIFEDFIWNETESHFKRMKSNLNEILKPKFYKLFENLISRVSPCSHLVDELKLCRGKVIEEIALIETWFKKPTKDINESFNLDQIVHAATKCFESIHHPKVINISINNCLTCVEREFNSIETLSLTRSLISMCQNSTSHGTVTETSPIVIDIEDDSDHYIKISVVNRISEANKKSILSSKQVEKVDNFTLNDQEKDKKLISEGGTGLYKTYRFITDTFESGTFKIQLKDCTFYQIAKVKNENINS
ncbi:hypothetical protein BCT47_12930 [Vibrio splendidus]|uniref:ATP-binding protein n=1 Tax=Vibrio splendidus TaxID=29497 RepID=A0AB35MWT2_VIBSP|nr:hypothetical protein [Vibrio splendidus]MDP2501219.1 hypothetical protein [Vibrio splendidus]PMM68891.1 hypothetical protein BCT47_12930 [Vibrio splendidus]